jgi:hypothetical protein
MLCFQVQLEQLEQFRVKYVTQKREERREGQLIKQRVEAYIDAEKQSETRKKMVRMFNIVCPVDCSLFQAF